MSSIWNKYKILKEINSNSNIKTYLTRIGHIIKEILPKNKNDYAKLKEKLDKIKNIIKIYEIIEEKDKLYIILDNSNEIISIFDELILSEELDINYNSFFKVYENPVKKDEKLDLSIMKNQYVKYHL